MAVCPFARLKLIRPGANDPPINPRMAILHVAVSNADSLYDFFAHRSGGIESHFYINNAGVIEQYRNTNTQADANYLANDFAISIETAGMGEGTWNGAQLASIKRLLRWLHRAEGIPLRKATSAYGSGVGYHVQFGAPGPWTPVAKSCPGPNRITQFHKVLVPWMDGGGTTPAIEEDDVSKQDVIDALADDKVLDQIAGAVWRRQLGGGDNKNHASLHLLWASNASRKGTNLLRGRDADDFADRVVAKLGGSVDAATVRAAVRDVLREGVEE